MAKQFILDDPTTELLNDMAQVEEQKKEEPKPTTTKRMDFMIDGNILKALKEYCYKNDYKYTYVINESIKFYLEEHKGD